MVLALMDPEKRQAIALMGMGGCRVAQDTIAAVDGAMSILGDPSATTQATTQATAQVGHGADQETPAPAFVVTHVYARTMLNGPGNSPRPRPRVRQRHGHGRCSSAPR